MCLRPRLCLLWVLLLAAALPVPKAASAQPGTVLSHQKISDTQGGFTAIIDNLDELGGTAIWLGDLDGPGPSVAAMAVGAAFDDDGGADRGAVYIMFLSGAGSVLSYQKISSTTGNFSGALDSVDEFGGAVAYLGDLDGPGPSVAALAVGAVGDDDGGSSRGAVWVLFLASNGTVLVHQKISNTAGGFTATLDNLDELGGAVANLGDLDGAGPAVTALAVGAVGDDDGGGDRGAVYILFLSSTGTVLSYQKISSTQGGLTATLDNLDEFGSSITGLGDLDGGGPGVGAVAVGAVFDDDGGLDRGAVYVLFLSASGTVLSHQKISDTQGGFTEILADLDEFGGAVENLGDLDGSGGGVTAMAVGTAGDDDGGEDRGAVYVVFLAANGTVVASQKISDFYGGFTEPLGNLDYFGSALACLGDLDGAGPSTAALAVGTTGDDDGGTDRGAVYVLFLDGVSTTGVPSALTGPTGTVLGRAAPNPFHRRTTIPFRLSEPATVTIAAWDVGGRRVRTLFNGLAAAGEHRADWDGRDDMGRALAPGTYFVRMTVNGRVTAAGERAVLLR